MIENRSDLSQCEELLARECQKVSLLGEIGLRTRDFDRIKDLIEQRVSADPSQGTRFLARKAPTCLACFLVWAGLVGYEDGDYWSAVQEFTSLPDTPYWEQKLGRFFLDFLEAHDLPRFDIEGGHTYVTPILTHGGIPNSCLEEYFEEIVLPMVQRDLLDPSDPEEIRQELSTLRQYHQERKPLEQERAAFLDKLRSLEDQMDHVQRVAKAFSDVTDLWDIEREIASLDIPEGLPSDYEAFTRERREELRYINEKIAECRQRELKHQRVVAEFTDEDRQILAQADTIETAISQCDELVTKQRTFKELAAEEKPLYQRLKHQSQNLFSNSWKDKYGEILVKLPLDELRRLTRQLSDKVSRQKRIEGDLNRLAASPPPMVCSMPAFLAALALLAIGGGLITIGVLILGSWVLTGVGAILVSIGLIALKARNQRASRKRQQTESLERSLSLTISAQNELHSAIADLVAELPIAKKKLHPPSLELPSTLTDIIEIYQQVVQLRQQQRRLRQEIAQGVKEIEKVATEIGVEPVGDVVSAMQQRLSSVRERKEAASRSQAELQDDIYPELKTLEERRRAVSDDLARVDNLLAELDAGDIEAGFERVKRQRRQQERAANLRATLESKYPDFDAIEEAVREMHNRGESQGLLQEQVLRLQEEVENVKAELKDRRRELSYYPVAFPMVDAPIRRYLIHAGASAEEFLVHSVQLMHQTLSLGEVPESDRPELSDRVTTAFEHWWADYGSQIGKTEQAEDESVTTRSRFRKPSIWLDMAISEISVRLPPQCYRASGGETSARLIVVAGTSDSTSKELPLRAYRTEEGLLETQELEFPLPFPCERYRFTLKSNGTPIHRWEIDAMRDGGLWMAFDGRSGRLVRDTQLPRGKAWLVGKHLSFEPATRELDLDFISLSTSRGLS